MKRILCVDDSDVIRDNLRSVLVKAGYEVVEATNGNEGLSKAIEQGPFDLIFTDYNMPGLNGLEMTQAIHQDPKNAKTLIIVLTTESGTDLRKKGQEAGVRTWLVKPINEESIVKVLNKLLAA